MINDELISVDSLLHDTNRQRLNANGISAIEDPKRLTKLISVEGWQPVDANIKVSDVAKLVGCIGGAQLYGDNVIVPLRELIQNASDAIRARRILENEGENYGHIIIRTGKEKNEHYYIEVEDNGIGMSQRVLTGPFLDFGKSLWGTSLMHEELPGLEVKGFSSTGKYGIVFFSVFMWGKRVTIATRRYEAGREKTKILEFNDGIAVRPILRKAGSNEFIKSGGTRIRVWLKDAGVLEKMLMRNCHKEKKKSFEEIIENLCPSIDCDILFEKNSINRTIINANDWKQISSYKLLQRIIGKSTFNSLTKDEKQFLQKLSKNMRFVKGLEGEIVGRALIYKEPFGLKRKDFLDGVVTVGGFRTTHLSGIIGIFIGKSDRASRDIGIPIVTNQALQEWATDQADLISDLSLELDSELECASIIRECGGETKQLKIAFNKNGSCNYNEIENYIKEQNNDSYLVIQDASVHIYERDHSCKVEFMENVFWSDSGQPGIFQYHGDYRYIEWPDNGISWFHSQTLQGLIIEALCEVWDTGVNGIIKVSDISSDNEHFDSIVGYANGKEVIFDHLDTVRKPK
nr:ATP-binding protein [Clostridium sp. WB02_MRS01]